MAVGQERKIQEKTEVFISILFVVWVERTTFDVVGQKPWNRSVDNGGLISLG